MSSLLFKSKGIRSSQKGVMFVCDIILLICGVAGIFLSQMKHATHKATISTTAGNIISSGDLGGGYILKENARNIVLIISIILIILALIYLESIIMSNKSYIKVFDDHIEAMQYAAFLIIIKKPLSITYDKIKDVEYIAPAGAMNTDKIVIYTNNGKSVLVVKDTEEAYQIIKNKI
ncbi:hypothetical protein [Ruminococcus sp.]|uniref:hypothetical protein n=1 Tax=Ruminococcus sp. TaxID=41978 RepID=UPI002627E87E|nr:hypothetical protein [Ruminococcus sp.]MDD6989478.1 hypothetical protein [Ruminococcus sp.]MDY6202331.1 hypothetical protein [Ruminococcus sp.]